jgi:hypothetical protein
MPRVTPEQQAALEKAVKGRVPLGSTAARSPKPAPNPAQRRKR